MLKKITCAMIMALSATVLATAATPRADYNLVSPLPAEITLTGGKGFVYNPATEKGLTTRIDPTIANPEGYRLTVTPKGIVIEGGSDAGIFYGRQTLCKAIGADNASKVELPAAVIVDEPRFAYRGMSLDVCRHFFPIDFVKTYLDILALHNINVLHLHISDDQGWRWESKQYPRLTELGSWRNRTIRGLLGSGVYDEERYGGYYTQDELKGLVAYAADRHITIIPEVDMPGHMLAALAAYPELGCTGGPYEVGTEWGVFPDVLCMGNDKTMEFLENIFSELIEIFPSRYIHVGGDECPRTRWKECPKCQARIQELGLVASNGHSAEDLLQSWCTGRLEKFLNAHGRQIIGWDELLQGEVAPGATIMSWQGTQGGIKAANMGHDVVMTPNTYCYFDYYQTADTSNEPLAIGGCTTMEKVYSFDPVASLNAEEAKHIIGVQANVWTEYILTPEQVEYMALPRMAALCEVQWGPADRKKDYESFSHRADHMTHIYQAEGWNYAKHLYNLRATVDQSMDDRNFHVKLYTLDNAPCRYTLDGSLPNENSLLYDPEQGITIDSSCNLRAVALRPEGRSNEVSLPIDFNLATLRPVKFIDCYPHPAYEFPGMEVLTNGRGGENNFADGTWLGFLASKVTAEVDLGAPQSLGHVSVGTLDQIDAWILAAHTLEVALSNDGVHFTKVDAKSSRRLERSAGQGCDIYTLNLYFTPQQARYLRVTAITDDVLPPGHISSGASPFIFLDEIKVTSASHFPITGTWVNLFYQDERNKYMNPKSVDMFNPELWETKVNELAEIGIEYLVLMAVANEGKAAYPSALMPTCYPTGQKCPVQAILDAAADRGLKVFMSSGWAHDQHDNLRIPETKARQIEMMDELAQLYGTHPAFYGWYLPVEDSLGPVLSEYSVKAVNDLTAHARQLVRGSRVMVSPYGLFNSDFSDPNYAQRIQALDVDIIAYQDEVGCVREADPLGSLRIKWPIMRQIHDATNIEIWANCELFVWEKEPNSQQSALLPAPLDRVQEQLQVATDGGVSRIISFAVCGIWDAPSSPHPIGVPGDAQAAYSAYKQLIQE